jgi:hypothetical protein
MELIVQIDSNQLNRLRVAEYQRRTKWKSFNWEQSWFDRWKSLLTSRVWMFWKWQVFVYRSVLWVICLCPLSGDLNTNDSQLKVTSTSQAINGCTNQPVSSGINERNWNLSLPDVPSVDLPRLSTESPLPTKQLRRSQAQRCHTPQK